MALKPIARKAFVVVERVDMPEVESKTLHIPDAARKLSNVGRVVDAGPDVVGLETGTVVTFGIGVLAEVGGFLFMRDDNVLAIVAEVEDEAN